MGLRICASKVNKKSRLTKIFNTLFVAVECKVLSESLKYDKTTGAASRKSTLFGKILLILQDKRRGMTHVAHKESKWQHTR